MNESIIEIKNLHKSFGSVHAVNDLSFSVKKGELFAFLGLNGAGKSTTISIMSGQLAQDSGEVFICGKNIKTNSDEIKRSIGIVFQNSVMDKPLTVRDNLTVKAAMYDIYGEKAEKRISYLAEKLEFSDILNRTFKNLSGGQKRKIDIARALIHEPKILILDEPTTGLDPQTRKKVWEVIEELQKENGLTVFLTTHYMEEAVNADHVLILDSGIFAAEGTPVELKNRFTGDYIILYGAEETKVKQFGKPYSIISGAIKIEVSSTAEATSLIMKYPELFCDYEIIKGNMDDVFLAATGKVLNERGK